MFISINTFAKVLYYKEDATGNLVAKEIGYTSSSLEKEGFLQHVSACLGIRSISYMGNALVTIDNNNGSQPTGLVPIIHWEGDFTGLESDSGISMDFTISIWRYAS